MPSNAALVDLYLETILVEGTAVESSVETYRNALACYLRFVGNRKLADITRHDVVDYLASLEADLDLAPATIALRRAAIHQLHRFMVIEGHAESDPVALLDPARRAKTLPTVFSEEDVSRLLDYCHGRAQGASLGVYRQASAARVSAMLETLYASGMRISEALTLVFMRLRPNGMMITGKGGKERLVFLHEKAIAAIHHWRDLAQAYHGKKLSWVFCSLRTPEEPLTRVAVFYEIKKAALEAGIANADKLSAHKLRHAFASHLLHNGVDLRTLQELMGHASIATTEIYTHLLDHRTKDMVRDLHPLNHSWRERH